MYNLLKSSCDEGVASEPQSLGAAGWRERRSHYAMLAQKDPILGGLMQAWGLPDPAFQVRNCSGITMGRGGDVFACLVRFVLEQQSCPETAATRYALLSAGLGAAPTPILLSKAPHRTYFDARIPPQKIASLQDLARRQLSGAIMLEDIQDLSDDVAVEMLASIIGFGRWRAEIFLMCWLGRPDILPASDIHLRRATQRSYDLDGLPSIDQMRELGKAWAPFRSIATLLLWYTMSCSHELD